MDKYFKQFIDVLLEFDTNKQPDKKIHDVISLEPQEKTNNSSDVSAYKNIKQEILQHIHKQRIKTLKTLMKRYDIPKEVTAKWKELMVPISELSDEQNKEYAKQIASIYSIFKKYIETKKSIIHKQENREHQDFPLGVIKTMISGGKTLGEIADRFNVPKTTLAHKLKTLYQTSYSTLKKQMHK